MIYTPAKLRSDVLPQRNTIGLRNHRASTIYQASLVQSTDLFFPTHFRRTLVNALLHRVQRSCIESARSSSRLLHYFRHNRIRPRFIDSLLNRYIERARKPNQPNEFLWWKLVRSQNLSFIRRESSTTMYFVQNTYGLMTAEAKKKVNWKVYVELNL